MTCHPYLLLKNNRVIFADAISYLPHLFCILTFLRHVLSAISYELCIFIFFDVYPYLIFCFKKKGDGSFKVGNPLHHRRGRNRYKELVNVLTKSNFIDFKVIFCLFFFVNQQKIRRCRVYRNFFLRYG